MSNDTFDISKAMIDLGTGVMVIALAGSALMLLALVLGIA